MKLVPAGVARAISEKGLLASENAPKALFVGGVIGMVGSTVLACRATLKMSDVLDEIDKDKGKAALAKEMVDNNAMPEGTTYSEKEYRRDLAIISIRGIGSIARLYAPAVIVGGVSIAALTRSHNILQDRNTALTAAYMAVDRAYTNYRERVVERYGEDVDRELVYETEEVEIVDEKGKLVTTTRIADAPGSIYARFYAEWSTRNWSPDPDINLISLRTQQNWANERLRLRGHLFLNEVYDMLGMSHTEAGAIVGWRWHPKDGPVGDNYVDFGIFDGTNESVNAFFIGEEDAILLDFNVDGVIYNKLGGEPEVP